MTALSVIYIYIHSIKHKKLTWEIESCTYATKWIFSVLALALREFVQIEFGFDIINQKKISNKIVFSKLQKYEPTLTLILKFYTIFVLEVIVYKKYNIIVCNK